MATIQLQMTPRRLPIWAALLGVLPVILLTLTGLGEGFPSPLLHARVMFAMGILGVALVPLLIWKGWMWGGLLIYSFWAAIATQAGLDEIASSYKTPFTFLAALAVVIPALAFQFSAWRWRWVILMVGLVLALWFVGRMAGQYWGMVDRLGYTACYPSCLPVSGKDPLWWQVLLGLSGSANG